MIQQRPFCIELEGNEQVHVAVIPEVITQDRAEKRKLGYLPPAAKLGNLVLVDVYLRFHIVNSNGTASVEFLKYSYYI